MASYGICTECGRANWLPHKCRIWEWRTSEEDACGDDNWSEVRAIDAESAAEFAAEDWDMNGDYYLIRNQGDCSTIVVRDPETLMVTYWKVHAEAIPTYCANQITAD